MSETGTPTPAARVTIPIGRSPRWVAITPDGRRAYVAVDEGKADGSTLGGISVIDIATNTVTTTIMLGVVAGGPAGVAITPDGRLVYVPLFDRSVVSGVVRVIDTATNSVTTTVTLSGRGGGPSGVAITPDGRHVYVGTEQEINQDQGIVSVMTLRRKLSLPGSL